MLVGYVWLIGRMRDVQRVFAYHGAEHRAIHAYEHGRALTPENIREYPNAHPRCGTAFLLTVMVIALVAVRRCSARRRIWLRIVERIAAHPGHRGTRLRSAAPRPSASRATASSRCIYRPNIWLQSLTTRDPDDAQIEVAVAALST